MPHSDILVQLQQVSKRYVFDNSEITALDHINCNIYAGDFLVIAGPSGSGKSTLLNMVGCIDKPSEGRIFFDGKEITQIPVEKLNHLRLMHIGFIFQSFNLVPVLTAFENIELPLLFRGLDNKSIKERVEKYLHRVGIADKMHQKPSNLSGGQRQRLAIARALAGNPSLIVADEPTASLDQKNAESILSLLKELNEESGVTIVLASHDPAIIELTKKKLFMRDGHMVHIES